MSHSDWYFSPSSSSCSLLALDFQGDENDRRRFAFDEAVITEKRLALGLPGALTTSTASPRSILTPDDELNAGSDIDIDELFGVDISDLMLGRRRRCCMPSSPRSQQPPSGHNGRDFLLASDDCFDTGSDIDIDAPSGMNISDLRLGRHRRHRQCCESSSSPGARSQNHGRPQGGHAVGELPSASACDVLSQKRNAGRRRSSSTTWPV